MYLRNWLAGEGEVARDGDTPGNDLEEEIGLKRFQRSKSTIDRATRTNATLPEKQRRTLFRNQFFPFILSTNACMRWDRH